MAVEGNILRKGKFKTRVENATTHEKAPAVQDHSMTMEKSWMMIRGVYPPKTLEQVPSSVIFVLIYFLVLVLVLVIQLFFRFSFRFSFANNQIISNVLTKTC